MGRDHVIASSLKVADYLVLVSVCAVIYGCVVFSDRPLSIHEARLPQLARELVEGKSNWLLPQSGGRPWLERPPLPHWFTAGSMLLFRRDDSKWVARIPAAIMGSLIACLGAWMAAKFYGREFGLLAGIVIATTYEIYQYATLAEDDIYLGALACACMALFVKSQWPDDVTDRDSRATDPSLWDWFKAFVSGRPWPVVLFFILLGLTNWAKGPLVGAVPVCLAIGAYLIWNRDWAGISRYVWVWGWLIFLILTVAWPLLALKKYPDLWDNWRYDYTDRADTGTVDIFDQPVWYYLWALPTSLAPWIWAMPIGLAVTARRAWKKCGSFERFLWCWAIGGIVVLSIPARKHHHYLVPIMTPWAILSAQGLIPTARLLFKGLGADWTRRPWFGLLLAGLPGAMALVLLHRRFPGPPWGVMLFVSVWIVCVLMFYHGLWLRDARWLVGAFLVGFAVTAGWWQCVGVGRDPATMADLQFAREIRAGVEQSRFQPLMFKATIGLDFFRLQFNLPPSAQLLHNLSYLRDRSIQTPVVYVITRAEDAGKLSELGCAEQLMQSQRPYDRQNDQRRLTLFRLTLRPDLDRYPLPPGVGVMQAMERRAGPWCGPAL